LKIYFEKNCEIKICKKYFWKKICEKKFVEKKFSGKKISKKFLPTLVEVSSSRLKLEENENFLTKVG